MKACQQRAPELNSMPEPAELAAGGSLPVIKVALSLPAEYAADAMTVGRLEAALAEIPGVLGARLDVPRMELQLEIACEQVTPRQLVRAIYLGLGEDR